MASLSGRGISDGRGPAALRCGWLVCGLALAVAAAAGCEATYPASPSDPVPVVRLELLYRSATRDLAVGSNVSLIAYAVDADGVYRDVTPAATWLTSDRLILRPATFDSAAFTAIAIGTATITAVYQGATGTLPVTVAPTRTAPYLDLSPGDPFTVGAAAQARATLINSNAPSQTVTDFAAWTSSDPAVATVERGLVRAVSPGTAHITASYGGFTSRYALSIRPRQR